MGDVTDRGDKLVPALIKSRLLLCLQIRSHEQWLVSVKQKDLRDTVSSCFAGNNADTSAYLT